MDPPIDQCIECGSICLEPFQFSLELSNGTYLMTVNEKHKFTMKCTDIVIPTSQPTEAAVPTAMPSVIPSSAPTTGYPTQSDIVVNVSFADDGIPDADSYLSDPYGRFEASITVIVVDEDYILGNIKSCTECYVWQYREYGTTKWNDFDHEDNPDISMSVTVSNNE